jgi:hypothetical protein
MFVIVISFYVITTFKNDIWNPKHLSENFAKLYYFIDELYFVYA